MSDANFIPAVFKAVDSTDQVAHLANIEKQLATGFTTINKSLTKTGKTEVINHPTSISTPDVQQVVAAVDKLDSSITRLSQAVAQPNVTVEAPDLKPLQTALDELKTAFADSKLPEPSEPIAFVDEKFDEYKIGFDDFDEERPISTTYYLDGEQVAKVTYSYNEAGNLTGAKKA